MGHLFANNVANKSLSKKEEVILELGAKIESVEGNNKTFRKNLNILKKEYMPITS